MEGCSSTTCQSANLREQRRQPCPAPAIEPGSAIGAQFGAQQVERVFAVAKRAQRAGWAGRGRVAFDSRWMLRLLEIRSAFCYRHIHGHGIVEHALRAIIRRVVVQHRLISHRCSRNQESGRLPARNPSCVCMFFRTGIINGRRPLICLPFMRKTTPRSAAPVALPWSTQYRELQHTPEPVPPGMSIHAAFEQAHPSPTGPT
jgi:hypothetical protein